MKKLIISSERQVTLDGLMTISKFEDGTHAAEFMCCEDVRTEHFSGRFKVQGMRDGNVYFSQKATHKRNTPLFRDDNSTLSKGRNGRYYFVFSLREERLEELPEELIRQASEIAKKVVSSLMA
jgi:hypothetical protein